MSYQLLNSVLWNQRQLLELLVFKLEVEQLLLASGQTRWLSHSTAEIERLVGQLTEMELARAVESDSVALQLGLAGDATLSALAQRSPEPRGEILGAHRTALVQVAAEIETLITGSRELLTAGNTVATPEEAVAGNESTDPDQAIMDLKLQEFAYTAALNVGARVLPPTLLDYLR